MTALPLCSHESRLDSAPETACYREQAVTMLVFTGAQISELLSADIEDRARAARRSGGAGSPAENRSFPLHRALWCDVGFQSHLRGCPQSCARVPAAGPSTPGPPALRPRRWPTPRS